MFSERERTLQDLLDQAGIVRSLSKMKGAMWKEATFAQVERCQFHFLFEPEKSSRAFVSAS
jgi:hypothetical protein